MIWVLATAWARDEGGGVYVEGNAGGGWTDRLGPITRGAAGALGVGGYYGHFRGTYRFGNYWRLGVGLRWNPLYVRDLVRDGSSYHRTKRFVESEYEGALEIGRGADLMNLGGYWVVGVGPVFASDARSPFESEAAVATGMGANGAVVFAYSVSRTLAVTFRVTAGVEIVDGVSVSGGFGLGLLGRAPLIPLASPSSEL